MSNINEFVASVNRLENLIDSNQTDLKRDVESIIDRRFSSLKEEVNKLKSSHSSLGHITDLLTLLAEEDNRHNLSDLPDRIRGILSTITSNNHVHRHTPDLDASEIGGNVTVESVNILDELGTEGHVNDIETNVTSNGTHLSQIDLSEGGEVLGDNQNELLPEEPNETNPNCDISSLVPASPSDIPVIVKVEGSSSPQSLRVCNRWMEEIDGDKILYFDYGSNECIIKQEIKEEFDETEEFEIGNNGQSVQLGTQVKEEVESDEENVIGPVDGDEINVNQNESLSEQSNGTNQHSVNDNNPIKQQVGNGGHGLNESAIDECNESQTLKQSKFCKRKCVDKSLATESENLLGNSLPYREVSTQITIPRSKRIRVTSPLETETTKQLSTGSEVESIEGDSPNGDDLRGEGEEGVEQSEDEETWWDSETELGDDDEGGHYRIKTIKLKCIEDNCNAVVSNRVELHDHLRVKHHISPHRCWAEGCNERFEQCTELGNHVQHNHLNISTWSCLHCTKAFKSQNSLYHHLHLYHFEGQFKCGYGGCHYDRVATLRSEIRSHQYSVHPKTSSTIYTCQINNCGKAFNRMSNFNRHQQTHTGVKPFRCGWTGCVKSFTRKGDLNDHQRIHLQLKPYKCTWNRCDYASTTDGNVIKHIRTQHFHLPATQTKQRELGIEDNRNPRDYLLQEHDNSPV